MGILKVSKETECIFCDNSCSFSQSALSIFTVLVCLLNNDASIPAPSDVAQAALDTTSSLVPIPMMVSHLNISPFVPKSNGSRPFMRAACACGNGCGIRSFWVSNSTSKWNFTTGVGKLTGPSSLYRSTNPPPGIWSCQL